jgi:hypothetical protein
MANLKIYLQQNKAVSPDQVVANLTKEYQAKIAAGEDASDELQRLDQANKIAVGLKQNPALQAQFQQATIANKVLGNDIAPNTTTTPDMNPTSKFPTQGHPVVAPVPHPVAPTAGGPQLPPGVPAGSTVVGTSGGKPVYKDPTGKMWQ